MSLQNIPQRNLLQGAIRKNSRQSESFSDIQWGEKDYQVEDMVMYPQTLSCEINFVVRKRQEDRLTNDAVHPLQG
jgi:hypothetical protein